MSMHDPDATTVPYSRLRSRWRVGAEYFESRGFVAASTDPDLGLVDDLDQFASTTFDPGQVDSAVRSFYERTGAFQLDTVAAPPRWSWLALKVFGVFARSVGQTDFPVGVDATTCRMTSTVEPLHDHVVPAARPRCWVRTWQHHGRQRTLYAAAYTTHDHDDTRFLDIAFPFPRGTLASTLRFEHATANGTLLTTANRPRATRRDAGIRWLGRRLTLRLPMSETIQVWPAHAHDLPAPIAGTGASVVAQHHIRLCGLRFLTLYYIARPPA